mmetsp:Transcript_59945/g.126909  ORF Transcript_59945/g.126909 Transcript_59945/m.126909 type:complete len:301 (-) Transcript_59945:86-988(-)
MDEETLGVLGLDAQEVSKASVWACSTHGADEILVGSVSHFANQTSRPAWMLESIEIDLREPAFFHWCRAPESDRQSTSSQFLVRQDTEVDHCLFLRFLFGFAFIHSLNRKADRAQGIGQRRHVETVEGLLPLLQHQLTLSSSTSLSTFLSDRSSFLHFSDMCLHLHGLLRRLDDLDDPTDFRLRSHKSISIATCWAQGDVLTPAISENSCRNLAIGLGLQLGLLVWCQSYLRLMESRSPVQSIVNFQNRPMATFRSVVVLKSGRKTYRIARAEFSRWRLGASEVVGSSEGCRAQHDGTRR